MKRYRLDQLIFMAICCDLGLIGKKLIAPAANVLTDLLHIPGGVGTSFSLMFLVIAAAVTGGFGCATLMGAVQSLIALGLGMTGSMGALAPVGYIAPGVAIDVLLWLFGRAESGRVPEGAQVVAASMAASVTACLTANLIVFRLRGSALMLYASVACTSGAICGLPAQAVVRRLRCMAGYRAGRGGDAQ